MTNEKDMEEARVHVENMFFEACENLPTGINLAVMIAVQSEYTKRIRAEAVKAERERCAKIACHWFYGDQKGLAVDQLRAAILSDDQEANHD